MTTHDGDVVGGVTDAERQELHDELRGVARRLLARPRRGAALDGSVLVDSGWLGLEVPEHLGGAGAGFRETGLVLTEMGRAVTTSTFLGRGVLGIGMLQAIEPGALRDDLLERAVAGTVEVAAVLPAADGAVGRPPIPFSLTSALGRRLQLEGTTPFVPDAAGAGVLVFLAASASVEPVAVVVERGAEGLDVVPQPVLDATRALSRVTSDRVSVSGESILRFNDPDGVLSELMDRGAAAIACDSLGSMGAMLDQTVAYAADRRQFGRPIGSFQAVKHACADMLVALQVSSELVAHSTAHVADGHENRSTSVSMAKSFVTEAAVQVSGKAVQLHGGIGYTWEAGLHVYQKRALLNRSLFGAPRAHRRRLAGRYV